MSEALSLAMAATPSVSHHISSTALRMPVFAPRNDAPITQTLPKIPARVPAVNNIPRTTPERMVVARDRIRAAAENGQRVRSYEVALDLDLSEFHFARQFRADTATRIQVFRPRGSIRRTNCTPL